MIRINQCEWNIIIFVMYFAFFNRTIQFMLWFVFILYPRNTLQEHCSELHRGMTLHELTSTLILCKTHFSSLSNPQLENCGWKSAWNQNSPYLYFFLNACNWSYYERFIHANISCFIYFDLVFLISIILTYSLTALWWCMQSFDSFSTTDCKLSFRSAWIQ